MRWRERRPAKYEKAERECVVWIGNQRRRGLRVTSKVLRKKVVKLVRELHSEVAGSERFKGSAEWMKRFMGRYRVGWRCRNDNATKSAQKLAPSMQNFIKRLRALREEGRGELVMKFQLPACFLELTLSLPSAFSFCFLCLPGFAHFFFQFVYYFLCCCCRSRRNLGEVLSEANPQRGSSPSALRVLLPAHTGVCRDATCVDQTAWFRPGQTPSDTPAADPRGRPTTEAGADLQRQEEAVQAL